MKMVSKLKTFFWYLKHPSFYPFLIELVRRKVLNLEEHYQREKAVAYCKKNCKTLEEFLAKNSFKTDLVDFHQDQSSLIKEAEEKIAAIDIKMGGAGELNLLYNLILNSKPKNVVETGVAYGWSSLSILTALEKNQQGRLVSVDMPYPRMGGEDFVGIAVPQQLRERWKLVRLPDKNGILKALHYLGEKIDICHYDSDKSYAGRKWAYPILWDHLAEGGFFISDDIEDNIAFIEFSESLNRVPDILSIGQKYVGIIKK